MKKVFNKKNLMLLLDAIIAFVLFAFSTFGVINAIRTVKAEEISGNEIALRDVV